MDNEGLKKRKFFKKDHYWKFKDPDNPNHFDSIESYLSGQMKYANEPSTLYISTVNGFPDYLKIGITSIKNRALRQSDPYIGHILYESCKDEELEYYTKYWGDLVKHQCWLVEKWIFTQYSDLRSTIPELKKLKWGGYTETFKIPDVKSRRVSFIEDIVSPLMLKPVDSVDDWEEIMDQLIASAVERDLYNQRKQQIYKKYVAQEERVLKREIEAGTEDWIIQNIKYTKELWEDALRDNRAPSPTMLNKYLPF